jgi:hypothetical protein
MTTTPHDRDEDARVRVAARTGDLGFGIIEYPVSCADMRDTVATSE